MKFLFLILFSSLALANPVIKDGSVTTGKLANSAVTEIKIANDAVTSDKIAAGTIVSSDISPSAAIPYSKLNLTGAITSGDLSSGAVTGAKINLNATVSSSSGNYVQNPCSSTATDVTNLSVSHTASGSKNVIIEIIPDGSGTAYSEFYFTRHTTEGGVVMNVVRGATAVARVRLTEYNPNSGGYTGVSLPASFKFVDFAPAAGTYTYKVSIGANAVGANVVCGLTYVKLMVYEL